MPPKKLYPKSTTRDISFFICETKKDNRYRRYTKKYIFYTSRPEYVSTVIDQVPLLIILNTSGSFPAMDPLEVFGPPSASPPSSSITHENQGGTRTRHSFIQRGKNGGSDSAHSDSAAVRPGQRKFSPRQRYAQGGHHIVCVTEEKQWQHIFRQDT